MIGGTLEIESVSKSYGDFTALDDVSLTIASGEFLTLLGPSGSGKTTTLSIVAGFVHPDRGRVRLDGRNFTEIPPHKRNIGIVFQNYALFPHLTVEQNVAFPLEMRKQPKAEIARVVGAAIEKVHLDGFKYRKPRELSGGQQQRVALARALVFEPPLLLMDEPLGALDKNLRAAMQTEIVRISRELGITVMYVTHDQDEALTMSDRIAVFNHGRIEQIGAARDIYQKPKTRFVAGFIGESLQLSGCLARDGDKGLVLKVADTRIPVSAELTQAIGLSPGDKALLVVRPEQLTLAEAPGDPACGAPSIPVCVAECSFLGQALRVVCVLPDGSEAPVRLPPETEENRFQPGNAAFLAWKPEAATLLPLPGASISKN